MRVVFIGTGEIGVPTLERLLTSNKHEVVAVVTGPDKPVGREQRVQPSPIKAAVTGKKVPIFQPARIKDREAIEQIRELHPDVIVVVAYGQILPPAVLEIPRVGCLNVHASLLPRWRGASPIQAAIAAGDRETGLTIMYMDEGLDTGDMLLQHKLGISVEETGRSLHDRLAQLAPETLAESLRVLATGNAPRTPQDSALATYAPKLTREDGRIDWNKPAEIIERKIRAYNPWPGAFTTLYNRKLKIFSAAVIDLRERPGQFYLVDGKPVFTTADRALLLRDVQAEGKRRMSGTEFARGWFGRDAGDG
jgi:methionyl-tRNA formyltransferase